MLKAARTGREEQFEAEDDGLTSALPTLAPTTATPAVPVMTGTHFHALDEKGRVIIPSKLRPALTGQFWLMLDENDNVAIYNYRTGLDVFEYFEQMLSQYPGDADIAEAAERTTGAAELVTAEGNWRVQVPEILRIHAQLDKEIVTVGVINHAVMWDRERWLSEQERRQNNAQVRKVQAGILRAAASGVLKKAQYEQAKAEEEAAAHSAEGAAGSYSGRSAGELAAGRRPFEKAASTGDGGRSARVLALSKLGRGAA